MAGKGTLGSLVIDLAANTASFETDMGRAARLAARQARAMQSQAREMQSAFQNAAKNIVGALLSIDIARRLTRSFAGVIEGIDKVGKAAQKIGQTTEEISGLAYAAKLSEVGFDALTSGLQKFNKATVEAQAKNSDQARAFAALGVKITDANGKLKSNHDLLLEVADAFSKSKDGANKTAIAMALFGKSGADLIPFLNEGKKGIKEMTDEAKRLGLQIDDKTAKAADQFNDNLDRIGAVASGLGIKIAAGLLPVMTDLSESFIKFATNAENSEKSSKAAETGIRLIASTGIVAVSTFLQLGTVLGGFAAFWERIGRGNKFSDLKAGFDILGESLKDAQKIGHDYYDSMSKLWDDLPKKSKESDERIAKDRADAAAKAKAEAEKRDLAFRTAASAAAEKASSEAISRATGQLLALKNEADGHKAVAAAATLRFDVEQGRYKDLDAATKKRLLGLADEIEVQERLVAANRARRPAEADLASLKNIAAGNEDIAKSAALRYEVEHGLYVKLDEDTKQYLLDIADQEQALEELIETQKTALRLAEGLIGKKELKPPNLSNLSSDIDHNPFIAGRLTEDALKDEQEFYSKELSLFEEQRDLLEQRGLGANKVKEAAEKDHQRRLIQIQEQGVRGRVRTMELLGDATANIFGAIADLQDKSTRDGFEKWKKFQIAQAIVTAIGTALKAAQSVADTPYVGPYLAAAAAAAALAAGYAQVQQIRNTQYSGRKFGGSVNRGGMYEVAEGGSPELLRIGSKSMLMMGDKSGSVAPARSWGGGGGKVIVNHYGAGPGASTDVSPIPGGVQIDVFANAIEQRMASRVAARQGPLVATFEKSYPNMQRALV